jgi:hypothetical protein
MRRMRIVVMLLAAVLAGRGQTLTNAGPGLPSDPRAVFAAATPLYNFSDPALKPWHLKANYQLYDEKGKPLERGTYEYWWASPQVYRTSWTRPDATRTDWHTADGKHEYKATGEALNYFEDRLSSVLLSPLPKTNELDPNKFFSDRKTISSEGSNIPCYTIGPGSHGDPQVNASYCFDAKLPIVLAIYSHISLLTTFGDFVRMQGRVLPREVSFRDGERSVLKAKVDLIEGLNSSGVALTPAPDAILVKSEKLVTAEDGVIQGKIVKRTEVELPEGEQSGHTCLQITVGVDGHIHDPQVITSTSPALTAAALKSVSQWLCNPYKLNGEPVEAEEEVTLTMTRLPPY